MAAAVQPQPSDDVEFRARLGERMRGLRLERGLRLADLAAISGVSEPHLSRLENGQRWPSVQVLLNLSNIYGVDVTTLLWGPAAPPFIATHRATAVWSGREETGSGLMRAGDFRVTYTRASRLALEEAARAANGSPEAQLGMAAAGSFAMALARQLDAGGFEPSSVETVAEVQLAASVSGHAIKEIHLTCEVDAAGLDEQTLLEIAQVTKRMCVIGRALLAVPVAVQVRLSGKGSTLRESRRKRRVRVGGRT
jgi:osmotically inducible protein OsmC